MEYSGKCRAWSGQTSLGVCIYWGKWHWELGKVEEEANLKGFYKEALLKNGDYTQVQKIFKQKGNMTWFLCIYNRRDNWVARWRVDRKIEGNY